MSRTGWLLTALLALAVAALVTLTAPVPARIQAGRLHRSGAAPFCVGFTAQGFPCNRRVRSDTGRCFQHRGAVLETVDGRPPMVRL